MKCYIPAFAALLLASCNDGVSEELDDAAIRNSAASLERSADETTNGLIAQIEAEAVGAEPVKVEEVPAENGNAAK